MVALHYNVGLKELCASENPQRVRRPKAVAAYLLRKYLLLSFSDIGGLLSCDAKRATDHVLWVQNRKEENLDLNVDIRKIEAVFETNRIGKREEMYDSPLRTPQGIQISITIRVGT